MYLVLIMATVQVWSSKPGDTNPAGSGKSLTMDLNTTADYPIKTRIILARGGNGGGHGSGECDGTGDGLGPDAGPGNGSNR